MYSKSHAKPGIKPLDDQLYVITMLENPLRWRSRYWNYWAFENHVLSAGAQLYTVEVAFGRRKHEITEHGNPCHLQLRTFDEIWHKENALNLLLARLPEECNYVAWIDADVSFSRPDWAQETLQLLQHYKIIQMFSHAQFLGPDYVPLQPHEGYVYKKLTDPTSPGPQGYYPSPTGKSDPTSFWHPGFAWACRKNVLNKLGGFFDKSITGSGDWIMASALFGEVDRSISTGYAKGFKSHAHEWEARALKHIQKNVGYLPGMVSHHFHGHMKDRQYNTRWKTLVNTQYDPSVDLKRDWQGLYQLTDRSIELRDHLRHYNRARNEDCSC